MSGEIEKARTELEALKESVREGAANLRAARAEAARWAARWSSARARVEELVSTRLDELDGEIGELIESELELREDAAPAALTTEERLNLARELEETMPAAVKLNARRNQLSELLEELDWDLTEHETSDADELADMVLEGFTAEAAKARLSTLRTLARELAK